MLFSQRPMRIVGQRRYYGKGLIPPRQKLVFQIRIGLRQSLGSDHPQPFTSRSCAVSKLRSILPLACAELRGNPLDVEFFQRSPKLPSVPVSRGHFYFASEGTFLFCLDTQGIWI
jgi:hypothetical protein